MRRCGLLALSLFSAGAGAVRHAAHAKNMACHVCMPDEMVCDNAGFEAVRRAADNSCCDKIMNTSQEGTLQIVMSNVCLNLNAKRGDQVCMCADLNPFFIAPVKPCDEEACGMIPKEACKAQAIYSAWPQNMELDKKCPLNDEVLQQAQYFFAETYQQVIGMMKSKTRMTKSIILAALAACTSSKFGNGDDVLTGEDFLGFYNLLKGPANNTDYEGQNHVIDLTASFMGMIECTYEWSKANPSIYGDPHVTNVLQERFDINRLGFMNLIEMPRGAGEFSFLRVLADIQPEALTEPCHEKYIRSVLVNGKWLGRLQELSFSGQPWVDKAYTMGMRVRKGKWYSVAETRKLLGNATSMRFGPGVFVSYAKEQKKVGWKIRIRNFKMEVMPRRRMFLDMRFHLPRGNLEVGGLLGVDPHHEAEQQPDSCK